MSVPDTTPVVVEPAGWRGYWKAIVATVAAIAITVVQAWQAGQADGEWTSEDTIVTILAFLGAVLVYVKGNETRPATKVVGAPGSH